MICSLLSSGAMISRFSIVVDRVRQEKVSICLTATDSVSVEGAKQYRSARICYKNKQWFVEVVI